MEKEINPVTVFLVEDDDVDAETIIRSFETNRIANSVIRAVDGVQALEMLRAGEVSRPFIMLLDLKMPRMGGIELMKELRADENLASTVVFVLTTSKDEADLASIFKYRAAGYYNKAEAGEGFIDIVNVLESYWKIVHLPSGRARMKG
ncbi:two-component system response regulator [Methylophaga sp. 42_25_T18]|nr:two-component system response regulator [Methylophaga sp. 42_25_T18]